MLLGICLISRAARAQQYDHICKRTSDIRTFKPDWDHNYFNVTWQEDICSDQIMLPNTKAVNIIQQ